MTTIDQLPTPALLLDLPRLEANLAAMQRRAEALGVALRPHVKTHKCVEIAERQRALGAAGLTVSTLEEAEVLATHGFSDLTWAFPIVPGRLPQALALAERVHLGLVADGPEALDLLERQGVPLEVWLKVDCGYHRAGVDPRSERALELARRLHGSPTLRFAGLLSHSGHAYRGPERRREAAEEERDVMVRLAERLRAAAIEVPEVSVGSTPGTTAVGSLEGVTEIRPGNYAFYDHTQVALGSCSPRECAVTVLATVVSSQPGARHSVVDAGALALSRDPGPEGGATMGEVYEDHPGGRLHADLRVTSLSQEHGILSRPLPHGFRVRVLPNHSCLTVACFDEYHVVEEDRVVARWSIHRER